PNANRLSPSERGGANGHRAKDRGCCAGSQESRNHAARARGRRLRAGGGAPRNRPALDPSSSIPPLAVALGKSAPRHGDRAAPDALAQALSCPCPAGDGSAFGREVRARAPVGGALSSRHRARAAATTESARLPGESPGPPAAEPGGAG